MLSFVCCGFAAYTHAQTTEQLQAQIDQSTSQINQLKAEIAQLQSQLTTTSKQKQTLQNAIAALNLNIQKLSKSITLTNAQIAQKDSQIQTISGTISTTTSEISQVHDQVRNSLRSLSGQESESMVLTILSGGTLSSFFDEIANLTTVRVGLEDRMSELSQLKTNLVTSKTAAQQRRADLANLQQDLAQQKQGLAVAQSSQSQLLAETKNKESTYQTILAQKKAEEKSFEDTLIKLAAGLGKADTTTAPLATNGILSWPLDSVSITQYFGNTEFAQSGAYSGNGHNGIDFRATIGTPVRAALSGVVQEINQGAVKNCQYGKWVLVKHDNGLTSLYAHLSSVAVTKGQRVTTGDVVGYSGDTGYATGPHLHLTLYVSSAVTFKQYTCNNGASAYIPIVPLNAYLNPLSYLPVL